METIIEGMDNAAVIRASGYDPEKPFEQQEPGTIRWIEAWRRYPLQSRIDHSDWLVKAHAWHDERRATPITPVYRFRNHKGQIEEHAGDVIPFAEFPEIAEGAPLMMWGSDPAIGECAFPPDEDDDGRADPTRFVSLTLVRESFVPTTYAVIPPTMQGFTVAYTWRKNYGEDFYEITSQYFDGYGLDEAVTELLENFRQREGDFPDTIPVAVSIICPEGNCALDDETAALVDGKLAQMMAERDEIDAQYAEAS